MQISPADGKHNAFPSICRTASGKLLVVYRKADSHAGPKGVGILKVSTDNGNTWGAETTVLTDAVLDLGPAGIRTLQNGHVLLNGTQWNSATGTYSDTNIVVRKSTDEGATWGAVSHVGSATFDYWDWAGGPVCQISTGRIFMPTYGQSTGYHTDATSMIYSDDNGATWPGEVVIYGRRGTNECFVIQLAGSGRLLALMRTSPDGFIMSSFSDDLGRRWSFPEEIFTGSGSPAFVQLPNKTLRMYYRAFPGSPKMLQRESYDYGGSWNDFEVYTTLSYVYADSVILPDGRQYLVYAIQDESVSPSTHADVFGVMNDPVI